MQNGASYNRDTVAEIKATAKETAHQVRGASATSLLSSARSQIRLAQVKENEGDLKAALSALTKSASLVQMTIESSEFKADAEHKGALFKAFMDFQQVRGRASAVYRKLTSSETEGKDLINKTKGVEARLTELEKSAAQ